MLSSIYSSVAGKLKSSLCNEHSELPLSLRGESGLYALNRYDNEDVVAPGIIWLSMTTMGRRIRRGSPTISLISSSSRSISKLKPSFFTMGLLKAKAALAGTSPSKERRLSSVNISTKKSLSMSVNPVCKSNSLTRLQAVHFFHQYRCTSFSIISFYSVGKPLRYVPKSGICLTGTNDSAQTVLQLHG